MRRGARAEAWLAVAVVVIGALCVAAPDRIASISPGARSGHDCSLRAADGSYRDRLAPSSRFWLGTDAQGCDVLGRVLRGGRASLLVGIGATALATVVGVTLGLIAAARPGWPDTIVRRAADLVLSVPFVVGAILLLTTLGAEQRQAWHLVVVLAALTWPPVARLARATARTVLVQPYVEAARAMGAGMRHVLVNHVARNAAGPLLAFAGTSTGALIAAESTLTFLGVGLPVGTASWGAMIDQAQRSLATQPHLLLVPAAAVTATVFAFVTLAEQIRRRIDPASAAQAPAAGVSRAAASGRRRRPA